MIVMVQNNSNKGVQVLSLLDSMERFDRGRHLNKIGPLAWDTAERSFTNVHVSTENLFG